MCAIIRMYRLNITNLKCSIWQYSDPTARHRTVWQFRRKRLVWEHPAARYSAASWSTVHLRPVREQDCHPDTGGRRNFWYHLYWPNEHDFCPCTNQPIRKHVWTVGFSAGEHCLWRRNQSLRSPVRTRCWCNTIQYTTPRGFHVW
jgi:hypothetical protein